MFRSFPVIVVVDVTNCFLSTSSDQCKASVTLLLTALPQEENHNSVLIDILIEMIWCYRYTT